MARSEAGERSRSRRLGRYLLRGSVRDLAPGRGVDWDWLALKALELLPAALVVGALAAVAFRVAQPHAFKGPGFFGVSLNPQWKDNMSYVQKLVSGEVDYPPSHQWAARAPVLFMWQNLVLWGLGLPLGLSVWAGWALMAWQLLQRRSAHLLPWVWMTFTFFYQSIQFVKAMRYILPIYPTMALVGAFGLIWLWDWASGASRAAAPRRPRWARWLGRVTVGAIVIGTALWALAFTSIYTRPVTRIAASRWVNANIPFGSSTSFELWDDPVPMNVDGRLASDDYHMIRMEPYWEDVPEKRELLLGWLAQTDYIILSSNRLYGSIPRLSQRYPMTTRYYEMLFSGELGYEQIAEFVSRPRLLGLEIADDNAEESFTVYDHPKVTIFRKTARFDLAAIRAEFESFDLERIVRATPLQAAQAPEQLMLPANALAQQRAGGTWSALYDRGSIANRLPTLFWLLALYAVQVAGWPLLARLARWLPDAGHGLSKAFGLLLVAYLSWLLPSLQLATYSSAIVWLAVVVVAALSATQLWRHGAELRDLLRRRWRLVVAQEVLFLLLFAAVWFIRRANPDLWHPVVGGEKPMDLAYLNAVLKSSSFPPYDPWFAGGALNYYYFGWVIVGALVKLTGIVPEVAYNLALPTLFALLGVGVATVAHSLASRGDEDGRWAPRGLRVGLLGVGLVCLLGNLGELQLLTQGLISLGGASTMPGTPALGPFAGGAVGQAQHRRAPAFPRRVVVLECDSRHGPWRDQRVPVLQLPLWRPARPCDGVAVHRAGAGSGHWPDAAGAGGVGGHGLALADRRARLATLAAAAGWRLAGAGGGAVTGVGRALVHQHLGLAHLHRPGGGGAGHRRVHGRQNRTVARPTGCGTGWRSSSWHWGGCCSSPITPTMAWPTPRSRAGTANARRWPR